MNKPEFLKLLDEMDAAHREIAVENQPGTWLTLSYRLWPQISRTARQWIEESTNMAMALDDIVDTLRGVKWIGDDE